MHLREELLEQPAQLERDFVEIVLQVRNLSFGITATATTGRAALPRQRLIDANAQVPHVRRLSQRTTPPTERGPSPGSAPFRPPSRQRTLRAGRRIPLADARIEFDALLQKAGALTTNIDAITGMLIALLQPFRAAGFFTPRSREQLTKKYIGPAPVRDFIIEQLIDHAVLLDENHSLSVVRKNSASVLALLDNGTLNGAVRQVAYKVADHFKSK